MLGNKIPNSFTTDRALIAGGGLGAGLLNPAIPAGLLAGAGLYTKPMQGLLAHLVSTRPQAAQQVAGMLLQQTFAHACPGRRLAWPSGTRSVTHRALRRHPLPKP